MTNPTPTPPDAGDLPADFTDGMRHAADEDEAHGHHIQASYLRRGADRIEELEAGWQSIETAPKTEDYILAFVPNEGALTVFWESGPFFRGWMVWSCRSDGWQVMPTHWMPLPAPPDAPPVASEAPS